MRAHDYDGLFRGEGPRLWRALYAYAGGRRDVADDATAEAFARAIVHDGEIRSPVPWLYRTAFRLAAADLRDTSHRGEFRDAPVEDVDVHGTADLMAAMRALSPRQRAAVYLHYQAGFTVREVARMTGSTTGAVKVQLHRGRRRLRDLLAEDGSEG